MPRWQRYLWLLTLVVVGAASRDGLHAAIAGALIGAVLAITYMRSVS